jgi:hypothetical protein
MCRYWLYILRHELHVEGCTLALSASPYERDVDGAKLQTSTYKSWQQLSEVLLFAGLDPKAVRSTKAVLESEGLDTLRDVPLSPEQLRILGFHSMANVSPGTSKECS